MSRELAGELQGVLLLDEAYVDFVDPELGYDSVTLLENFDNLLILRSFSKGYSLAGLRLGYLLGQRGLIEPLITKTRDSYNVNAFGQRLGLAAFLDRAYAERAWASGAKRPSTPGAGPAETRFRRTALPV